jgi:hypothetical protein
MYKMKNPKRSPKNVKAQKFIDFVGPKDEPQKYGLMKKIGSGVYGVVYLAKNLNRQENEDDLYVVKILIPPLNGKQEQLEELQNDWIKETKCLKDAMMICDKVGILCFKDSFIINRNNGLVDYAIVTPFLDEYITLDEYFYGKDNNNNILISLDEAKYIYKKVVDIKNAFTELCINHSDLHTHNIMINPDTKDIRVIDMGRCQTPQDEMEEWLGDKDSWDNYSDEGRLRQLRETLFFKVYGESSEQDDEDDDEDDEDEDDDEDDEDDMFDDFEQELVDVKKYTPGCRRKGDDKVPTKNEFVQEIKTFLEKISKTPSARDRKTLFILMNDYSIKNKSVMESIPKIQKTLVDKVKELADQDDFFVPYYEMMKN